MCYIYDGVTVWNGLVQALYLLRRRNEEAPALSVRLTATAAITTKPAITRSPSKVKISLRLFQRITVKKYLANVINHLLTFHLTLFGS